MVSLDRQFIRHPTDIPLEFNVGNSVEKLQIKDVAEGGLCFVSQDNIDTGEIIHIVIPICDPKFDADGVVRWCKKDGTAFLVGVAFQQESVTFAVRMVEQLCHIEKYRQKIKAEQGIELSSEQAAMEWIRKYAHKFPSI
ncbi:MAG: PilZ domain-containing protein [Methylophagaceae bacterium]